MRLSSRVAFPLRQGQLASEPGGGVQVYADAHFLADTPQRVPKRIAETSETFQGDARIRQNVDAHMSRLNGALHLADNRFDGTHVRHSGKWNEAIACPPEFSERVIIGPDAVELERRV